MKKSDTNLAKIRTFANIYIIQKQTIETKDIREADDEPETAQVNRTDSKKGKNCG